MSGENRPQGLDTFSALARIHHVNGAKALKQWSVDFPHAYITIALGPSSSEAANICFPNPAHSRPYKCKTPAQPFGNRRAPANRGRAVSFIQFLARRLLAMVARAYVDDVFFSESSFVVRSGFRASKRLCGLLSFVISGRKDQKLLKKMHFLGAMR